MTNIPRILIFSSYFPVLVMINLGKLHEIREDSRNLVLDAAVEVVAQLWAGNHSTVSLIDATNNSRLIQSENFEKFLTPYRMKPAISFRIETLEGLRYNPVRPKKFIIIFIESINDLRELYKLLTPKLFLYRGWYVIALLKGKTVDTGKVFSTFWSKQIYNVNVIYETDLGSVRVETYLPFHTDMCGDPRPFVVNEFVRGKFLIDMGKFFPEKMRDLHQCTLRVATSNNSEPYIFAKKNSEGKFEVSGRDINLIKSLAQALNFKIDFVYIGDEGFLYDNGTAGGPFELLMEGKADLIIADYWLKVNRLSFVDHTTPYSTQQIAFVIPPGAKLTTFEKFIKPLDMYTWICLIVFIGVGFATIIFIDKCSGKFVRSLVFGRSNDSPYMNMLTAIFGGSQKVTPLGNFTRSLLMMFLCFCLIMRTLYTGSLYRFLQSKGYHKEVQSIDEMIVKDFVYYTVTAILDLLQGQSRISQRLVVFNRNDRDKILREIATNPDSNAALMRSLTGIHYANQMNRNETQSLICKEIFLSIPVVIYIPRDFYLKEALDRKIELVQAAGLIDYWHSQIIDERYLKVDESSEPEGIKFEYLSGTFIILIAVCGFAGIVFVCEVVLGKYRSYVNSKIIKIENKKHKISE